MATPSGPTSSRSASQSSPVGVVGERRERGERGVEAEGARRGLPLPLPAGRPARARRGCRARPRRHLGTRHPTRTDVYDRGPRRHHPRPSTSRGSTPTATRSSRTRSSPSSSPGCATRSAGSRASSASQPLGTAAEGHSTLRMYNLLAKDPIFQAMPVHPNVLPIVERLLDRGLPALGHDRDRHRPGRGPQPMHGDDIVMSRHLAAPARADDGDEHVGAHRLHRARTAGRATSPARTGCPYIAEARRSTSTTCARSRCRPAR